MSTLEDIEKLAIATRRTGSSVVCNPPVTDTDIDIVVLCPPDSGIHDLLKGKGYKIGGSFKPDKGEPSRGVFLSYKKEEDGTTYNFLVTSDFEFYGRFGLYTEVAKRLNLLNKQDRVILAESILYGKYPKEPSK